MIYELVVGMRIWLLLIFFGFQLEGINPIRDTEPATETVLEAKSEILASEQEAWELYTSCQLSSKLDSSIFYIAYAGYGKLRDKTSSPYLTIIDYTKPSTQKRLFIIDVHKKALVYHTLVAHGKNSGDNIATSFSNIQKSLKSSPGFFITSETYLGKHGYSLRLDGLEKGLNDNARSRAIVIHGARYVSPDFIKKYNRLGRSWGCPAVPSELSSAIIDLIKGGSCIYIHTDDQQYHTKSSLAGN